jgi:hypothetical protein
MSYLYSVHCYDNPTVKVAAEMFQDTFSRQSKAKARWKMAYTMLIDPQLLKYRKSSDPNTPTQD